MLWMKSHLHHLPAVIPNYCVGMTNSAARGHWTSAVVRTHKSMGTPRGVPIAETVNGDIIGSNQLKAHLQHYHDPGVWYFHVLCPNDNIGFSTCRMYYTSKSSFYLSIKSRSLVWECQMQEYVDHPSWPARVFSVVSLWLYLSQLRTARNCGEIRRVSFLSNQLGGEETKLVLMSAPFGQQYTVQGLTDQQSHVAHFYASSRTLRWSQGVNEYEATNWVTREYAPKQARQHPFALQSKSANQVSWLASA